MDLDDLANKAIESCSNYNEYRDILKKFKDQLEFEYNMMDKKMVIVSNNIDKAVFFGDIHGDLHTLYLLIKETRLLELLRNGWYAVFLGDYIDRGENQLEVLALISLLKNEYPSRVITLRGNHEPVPHLVPYPHDYIHYLVHRFGKADGLELYELSRELFNYMPLALYIYGKLFAVHGGPPIKRVQKFEDPHEILSIENDIEAIEDMLWSDPIENDIEYVDSYRGAGKLWGIPITKQTLRKLNIKLIVRGHEPVNGYRFSHDGKVLTLFSMKGHYGNSCASCLKLHLDNLDEDSNESLENVIKNNIISV
ncbi:MAG: metallophosphoesterase family protein [Ignisphaera sp.]|uniref:Serine/threonine protein phosphatase n=1 Tax=Ignisphaera aggregans TaxID=334771 RepID=A0A7J3MYZ1_9CREN